MGVHQYQNQPHAVARGDQLMKKQKPRRSKMDFDIKKYFKDANDWEQDRSANLIKSARRGWIAAGIATTIAICAVFAVAALAPLKTVVPYVIRVDNTTGIVDVASGLDVSTDVDYEEAIDKYFLSKYILHREGYLFQTLKHDRDVVGLMSSERVGQQYTEYTDYRKNPQAPVAIYGETAEVKVKIQNISFLGKDVAQVRYTKTVTRAGKRTAPSHWAATITFRYSNANMKPEDRLISPLGFQATQYRNDPVTVGAD